MSEKLTFDISWRGLRSIDCNCCMIKKHINISMFKTCLSRIVFHTKNICITVPPDFVSWAAFLCLNSWRWLGCHYYVLLRYATLRYVTCLPGLVSKEDYGHGSELNGPVTSRLQPPTRASSRGNADTPTETNTWLYHEKSTIFFCKCRNWRCD